MIRRYCDICNVPMKSKHQCEHPAMLTWEAVIEGNAYAEKGPDQIREIDICHGCQIKFIKFVGSEKLWLDDTPDMG